MRVFKRKNASIMAVPGTVKIPRGLQVPENGQKA